MNTERAALNGVALDLGGTKLVAARIEHGVVAERIQAATRATASAAEQVADMRAIAEKVGLAPDMDVALAVTGRLDAAGVWGAVNTATLSNLADINLRELAADAFSRRVSVINDAQAAALAEFRFGSGRRNQAMAYITVSTGVGGGLVLGGIPVESPNGLAGHVGFSTSRLASHRCGCGRIGTMESIASGRAIAAEAHRRGHGVTDAREVFEQWHAGADWAAGIVTTSAAAIAELSANLAAILGIERVVLGGSIGLARGYAELVRTRLAAEPPLFQPDLVTAELGHDGALLGALAASNRQGGDG